MCNCSRILLGPDMHRPMCRTSVALGKSNATLAITASAVYAAVWRQVRSLAPGPARGVGPRMTTG